MSTQYVSFLVMILAVLLPKLGIVVGSDELTTTATTIIAVAAGVFGMYRRYMKGDITVAGVRV